MAKEVTTGKFSFLDIVFRVSDLLLQGRKQRAKTLKLLADKKFRQLEVTHGLFIRLLRTLAEAARNASVQLDKSDDVQAVQGALIEAIQAIEVSRWEGKESRMNDFREAMTFANRTLEDRGILATLDPRAAENLRALMGAYVDYFQVDNAYLHELGRALGQARGSLVAYEIRRKRFDFSKVDLKRATKEVEALATAAIEGSRTKWGAVSLKYHELNYHLVEHGWIDQV